MITKEQEKLEFEVNGATTTLLNLMRLTHIPGNHFLALVERGYTPQAAFEACRNPSPKDAPAGRYHLNASCPVATLEATRLLGIDLETILKTWSKFGYTRVQMSDLLGVNSKQFYRWCANTRVNLPISHRKQTHTKQDRVQEMRKRKLSEIEVPVPSEQTTQLMNRYVLAQLNRKQSPTI